jgi:hypothetical protein
MNHHAGFACHDCTQLIANGEIEGAPDDWDVDAALATQENYEVSLATGEEYFSYITCAVCDSTLPGFRQAVELVERK